MVNKVGPELSAGNSGATLDTLTPSVNNSIASDLKNAAVTIGVFRAPNFLELSKSYGEEDSASLLTPFLDLVFNRRINDTGALAMERLFAFNHGLRTQAFVIVDSVVYPEGVSLPTGLPSGLSITRASGVDISINKMIVPPDEVTGFDTVKTVGGLCVGDMMIALGVAYRGADDRTESVDKVLAELYRWFSAEFAHEEWNSDSGPSAIMARFILDNATGEILWQDRRSALISGEEARATLWKTLSVLANSLRHSASQGVRSGQSIVTLSSPAVSPTDLPADKLGATLATPPAVRSHLSRIISRDLSRVTQYASTADTRPLPAKSAEHGLNPELAKELQTQLHNLPAGATLTFSWPVNANSASIVVRNKTGAIIQTIDTSAMAGAPTTENNHYPTGRK